MKAKHLKIIAVVFFIIALVVGIVYAATLTKVINLSGTVNNPANPSATVTIDGTDYTTDTINFDWGTLTPGSNQKSITITNTGNTALTLQSVTCNVAPPYQLSCSLTNGASIPIGQHISGTITLTVPVDAPDEATVTATITLNIT